MQTLGHKVIIHTHYPRRKLHLELCQRENFYKEKNGSTKQCEIMMNQRCEYLVAEYKN